MSQDRQPEISALVAELAELARNAPAKLRERVASLEIRQQAELALRLPARQRLELLLHAPQPMRLVRSLPESEFYLTVREVGPTDALPLVSLGSTDQLQHLLDLESWRHDRFDPDRSGAWVALLLEAGEPTIRRFLRSADDEQLGLLFQRWIRTEPMVPDEDHGKHGHGMTEAGDELGLISPDGNFRFTPTVKEHGPAIQRIAQVLFLDQRERYHRLLWAALYELPGELEEGALRWRQSRLEERGFPPWEEALSVYAAPQGVREHPQPPPPLDADGPLVPRSALNLPAVQEQLGAALERLDDDARDRVLHEFFGLGNRLLVADRADAGEPLAHRAALVKAAGYVGIALETRGAHESPHEIVKRVPLIELFREGYSKTVDLAQRARALTRDGWAAAHPRSLELLDSPIRERLEALLETRPLYYEVGDSERPSGARFFRSIAEIDETRVTLEIAEVVGQLLVDRLGLDVRRVLEVERPERAEPPRLSTFVLTFLAWHATRDELRGDPLPEDVVSDFLRTVASRRTADPAAPRRSLDTLIETAKTTLELSPKDVAVLDAFGGACLEQLAAECGSLDPGGPVDPRFVSCLLIEYESN